MLKVLIVDDSPILRRTMRTYLEEHPGMQVCGEAGNGEEAVAKFRQLRPDFVILDFAMPVMNGIEAARRISSLAPSVPLVMFTLFKSDQLTREAQEAGIDRVLSKDETHELMRAVDDLAHDRNAVPQRGSGALN